MTQVAPAADSRSLAGRLTPLLVAAACLLGANGLSVTMISVRAKSEGMSDALIGLLGSCYFGGMIVGVLLTPFLIARAGHIRVFSTLAAISAIAILAIAFTPAGWLWMVVRLVSGAAFCGTTMVLESWLNSIATNSSRGRILSVYRIVDMIAVMGSQFMLPAFGPLGPDILIVLAILFCFALVPISLTSERNPAAPPARFFDPLMLWRVSPVALVAVFTIGLTNGAFRMVGPVYAEGIGLGLETVAAFIAIWVFAGAIFQYPAGWLSDRLDRRVVLGVFTVGAGLACLFISGSSTRLELFCRRLPVWRICPAALFSLCGPCQRQRRAGTIHRCGGRAHACLWRGRHGGAVHCLTGDGAIRPLGLLPLYRHTAPVARGVHLRADLSRDAVPASKRHRFVWLLRTSPMIFRLARNDKPDAGEPPAK